MTGIPTAISNPCKERYVFCFLELRPSVLLANERYTARTEALSPTLRREIRGLLGQVRIRRLRYNTLISQQVSADERYVVVAYEVASTAGAPSRYRLSFC